jgi:hypothetical protein
VKSQKYSQVSEACLAILSIKGLNALNLSGVAKRSGVSRAWIYKYIGGDKEDLLTFSLKTFGEKLLEPSRVGQSLTPEEWKNYYLPELTRTHTLTKTHPWLPNVYYRYRYSSSSVGKVIREIELNAKKARAKELTESWGVSEKGAKSLASVLVAIRMGLAFHWISCSDEDVKDQMKVLNDLVGQLIK